MDDRDLEARLRAHLHRRFDGAYPSPELMAAIQQGFHTQPRRLARLPQLALGGRSLSWAAVGAVGLVAVLAVAGLQLVRVLPPGAPGATATTQPSFATSTKREFIVLAAHGASPSAADRDRATEVLIARLTGLGVEGTRSERTDAIIVEVSVDGPPDAVIRNVLSATGDVAFVPLPDAYGEGTHTAQIGQPLPTDEPALFGWEGIESVGRTSDEQDREVLSIDLRPDAVAAFGDYTANNVGSTFAVLIDGEVALLPTVNEPIPGGEILLSGGGLPGSPEADRFREAAAIFVGGRLPDSWAQPRVPVLVPPDEVAAAALLERPDASVVAVQLGVDDFERDGQWEAVWRVTLAGEFLMDCEEHVSAVDCPRASTLVSTVDASSGEGVGVELLP